MVVQPARGIPLSRIRLARKIREEENAMLRWALIFLVVAIVAGIFGFAGIMIAAAGIAKLLFYLFLVLFLVSLLMGLVQPNVRFPDPADGIATRSYASRDLFHLLAVVVAVVAIAALYFARRCRGWQNLNLVIDVFHDPLQGCGERFTGGL